jgi:Resolvase, N terminal domain
LQAPKGHVIFMGMNIGYARVSTDEQNLALQRDALEAAGCVVIYQDAGISGIVVERHGLAQMLSKVGAGDTLVVWKLDWPGRSLGFLCQLVERLGQQGAGFQSLTEGIDTTTNSGKLVFHIMGGAGGVRAGPDSRPHQGGHGSRHKKRGKHIGRLGPSLQHRCNIWRDLLALGKAQRTIQMRKESELKSAPACGRNVG